ncbi:MAG TPA: NADPH-dependent FMN reductase [Candidatus Omnitrophota bacterium]|nr:NADPH-dependent FMN reductase [Candidatus Omnitrophota bacterium]
MAAKKIAVIVGSLRKGSFNRKIAEELMGFAPASLKLEMVGIGDLPLYNQDFDDDSPASYTRFRELIKGYDGFLFVTPEHNRSMPAALKNALDIGSRPYGKNVWGSKPGAVVSVSVGPIGGFGANHHLRQALVCLNVAVMPREAYIGNVESLLDQAGRLANETTRKSLSRFVEAFAQWVDARNG